MEIYLIRHTATVCDKGICYGHSDVDLAPTFEMELKVIKNKLSNIEDLVFFSSPLKRCSILAQRLTNSSVYIDDRLKELNFGDWELKSWNSIDKHELQKWINDYVNVTCPNGESLTDLYNRSVNFVKDLKEKKYEKLAIITHAGVIRSIISYIIEIPITKMFSIQLDYGSITKIKIDGSMTNVCYINR